MSIWLVLGIAVLTYASRAIALVAMPEPSPRVRAILDRIPGPLFAALAATSLFDDGLVAQPQTLIAALGALLLAPTRSMLWVLGGGVAAYGVAELVL